MNRWRAGRERLFHIHQHRQRLPVRFDQRQRVFGLRARLGNNRRNRFALPAGTINRHRVLRRRFDAFQMSEHGDPWRAVFGNCAAIKNSDHARLFACRIKIQLDDFGVRMRAAKKHDVCESRELEIIGVGAATLQQSFSVGAGNAATDVAFGGRRIDCDGRGLMGEFSARVHAATFLAMSTDSMALTMA